MDVRTPQRLRRKVSRGEAHSAAEPHPHPWDFPGEKRGALRATWTDEETERGRAPVLPILVEQLMPELLGREGPAGLAVAYVVDGVPLTRRHASIGEQREADLDAAAWRRLEQRSVVPRPIVLDRGRPRLAPEPYGLWALCAADGSDGARLLTRAQRERLLATVGAGPYRVSLARRELVLLSPVGDAEGVAALEALAPAADGIAGVYVLGLDGVLHSVAPAG